VATKVTFPFFSTKVDVPETVLLLLGSKTIFNFFESPALVLHPMAMAIKREAARIIFFMI
jgi:hypothetical protein